MLERIQDFLQSLNNTKVLIACSTGVDSMTLLHLVMNYYPNELIYVAHINHKVRKESDIEEEYITKFCKDNNLKLFKKSLDPIDSNFESTARSLRLGFFEDICLKEDINNVLLAHHAKDNLETVLMRLLRSSSLRAYGGISLLTKYHNINLYHPLITTSKEEIIKYADEHNIKYFEDATNKSSDYERNRIRNEVIPIYLNGKEYSEAITNFSNTLIEASNYIDKQRDEYIKKYVDKNQNISFSIDSFINLDPFLQKQALFELLKPFNLTLVCINEILKNINSSNNKIVYNVTNNLNFIKEYSNITLTCESIEPINYSIEITKEGTYNLIDDIKVTILKNTCNILTHSSKMCYNIDDLPITIRTRKPKDLVKRKKLNKQTLKYEYYNQSLSNYLTNKKVPLLKRNKILVIEHNDSIIHVIGYKL